MNLIPYQFEGSPIRVVEVDGVPNFVASDVARALGYTNASKALNDHCKGVTIRYPLDTPGGVQQVRFITEPDVLRLIMGSRLPAAQQFERWVFETVLPAVRRHGLPAAAQFAVPQTLPEALRLAADLAESNAALTVQVAAQAPKVAALARIAEAEGALCLTDAAKHLQMPPARLIAWLASSSWIFRRHGMGPWVGYQHRIEQGYLVMKVVLRKVDSDGVVTDRQFEQVRITPRGLARLAHIFENPREATVDRAMGECRTILSATA